MMALRTGKPREGRKEHSHGRACPPNLQLTSRITPNPILSYLGILSSAVQAYRFAHNPFSFCIIHASASPFHI
jgi:hypothetical protein